MPDNTIALQLQQPNSLKSIGDIVGVARAAQDLQTGKIQQQKVGTELQQNQMDLQERQNLRQLAGRLGEFKGEDGNPDLDKLTAEAVRVAPKLGSDFVKNLAGAHVESLAAQHGLLSLSEEQRAAVGKVVMSVVDQPPDVQQKVIGAVVQGNPALAPWGKISLGLLNKAAAGGPDSIKQMGLRIAQSTMDPAGQNTMRTPQGPVVASGRTTQMINVNPAAGDTGAVPGTAVTAEVPPTSAEEKTTDALGRPAIQTKSPAGAIGFKAPDDSYKPLMSLPPGETAQTGAGLMAIRQQSNDAAAQAQEQHFNNKKIIELAPKAFTGSGAGALKSLFSYFQSDYIPGENAAENKAQLEHFAGLAIQRNAAAAGAGTDAARQLAAQATLPADSPEKALIRITKVNDALVTGAELRNKGLEAAVNNPNNKKDIFAVRDFNNQWSQAFDPKALMLHNSVIAKKEAKPGSKEYEDADKDIKEIVMSVSGKGSRGAESLFQKYEAMHKLSTEGHL